MSKRYAFTYAIVFSSIWIGFGLYSMAQSIPSAKTILLFGIGFAVSVCLLTWFSTWLMKHYKKVDEASKSILEQRRMLKKQQN